MISRLGCLGSGVCGGEGRCFCLKVGGNNLSYLAPSLEWALSDVCGAELSRSRPYRKQVVFKGSSYKGIGQQHGDRRAAFSACGRCRFSKCSGGAPSPGTLGRLAADALQHRLLLRLPWAVWRTPPLCPALFLLIRVPEPWALPCYLSACFWLYQV